MKRQGNPLKKDVWKPVGACLLLAGAVILVYAPVRHHEFVNYDDNVFVTENRRVAEGLGWQALVYAFTHVGDYPRPVTILSHMLDCTLYGLQPEGHHLTNLGIHLAGTLLLFWVLWRMMPGSLYAPLLAALFFGVHPLNVETVAWVTERKGVLAGLFSMLVLFSYVRYAEAPGLFRYLAVLCCFALGLLSKPSTVPLPFVLLVLDFWPLGRAAGQGAGQEGRLPPLPLQRLVLEKVPLFALAAGFGVVVFLSEHGTGTLAGAHVFSPGERVANTLITYGFFLQKILWPAGLAAFYPYPSPPLLWKALASLGALCLITALAWVFRKTRPYLLAGWAWFVIFLFPVAGLFQVGAQATADRYFYLPGVGLFVMVAWGAQDLWGRVKGGAWSRVTGGVLLAGMVMGMGLLARGQAAVWRDSKTLWAHALRVTRVNYLAANNLGLALFREGRTREAEDLYRRALEWSPGFSPAHNNLGVALASQGRLREAEACFQRALTIDPRNAQAVSNLGLLFLEEGRVEEAEAAFRKALSADPRNPKAHHHLALALAAQGRAQEGVNQLLRALEIDPRFAEAHNDLGVLLARQGRLEEARAHFSEALRILPGYREARANLEAASRIKAGGAATNRQ